MPPSLLRGASCHGGSATRTWPELMAENPLPGVLGRLLCYNCYPAEKDVSAWPCPASHAGLEPHALRMCASALLPQVLNLVQCQCCDIPK